MRSFKTFVLASCVAAAAVFAGCSGGATPSSGAAAALGTAGAGVNALDGRHIGKAVVPNGRQIPLRPDRRKSWISPDIPQGNPRLLWISDFSTGDVYLFLLSHVPSAPMKLKAVLTGFNEPQGMCVDGLGNMWITETGSNQIVKYSRLGQYLATLNDPDGGPGGCSVNPVNGDLAVANEYDGAGPGELLVFPAATGTPVVYTNPDMYQYDNPAYDTQGNLFVNGCTGSNGQCVDQFILSELPAGQATLATVNLAGGTINFPGMIQWYAAGNYLAIADQECNGPNNISSCIYPATISGSTATLGTEIVLNNSSGSQACDIVQPTINSISGKRYVAGGDYTTYCGGPPDTAYRWKFPAGGNPTQYNAGPTGPGSVPPPAFVSPWGAAISTH